MWRNSVREGCKEESVQIRCGPPRGNIKIGKDRKRPRSPTQVITVTMLHFVSALFAMTNGHPQTWGRYARVASERPLGLSTESPRDFSFSAFLCCSAMMRNLAFASSSGSVGLRFGLFLREGAFEPGFEGGAEGVSGPTLGERVLGRLGPSRTLAGPLPRYWVLLESWLRRRESGSRSKELVRDWMYSGSSPLSM